MWLFTDARRVPDVVAAVERLPRGLCGVVFRHDGAAGRSALIRRVARACRARRLVLVIAGRADAPPGAGRHLREGKRAGGQGERRGWLSASAHGPAGLVRARRAGADVAFLSPTFPTASHPGARPLGVWRWAAMAKQAGAKRAGMPVLALGGVDGRSARRLPRWAAGAGAIGALSG